jgi:NAD+ synthase (glutamine-hydrolysing)
VKIALGQINPTVGDFEGNVRKILDVAKRAPEGALVVFPELALCGYPPMDLLHKPSFLAAHDAALARLAAAAPRDILVGCVERNALAATLGGKPLYNAVALLRPGEPARFVARKCLLPTYDVFDEARYFQPWDEPRTNLLELGSVKIGVTICEDIWNDKSFWPTRLYPIDPIEVLVAQGAEVIVNLSASPWSLGKERIRCDMLGAAARRHHVPIVYVNQVGGNDGLIFDGGSMLVTVDGSLHAEPVQWREDATLVSARSRDALGRFQCPDRPDMAQILDALVLGIRDYYDKLGIPRLAVLGLSGGIDSSVCAAVAAAALGPENVVGIRMPSQYSSEGSLTHADALARNLGIKTETIAIGPLFDDYRRALAPVFAGKAEDVSEENLQARIRGALLMAYSNKHGHLVLATGNKTECSVGFATLYGDTCGGLAVNADLFKTEVYALARHFNREREVIPGAIIDKPASPELKPGQITQDHLPPFHVLDPVLRALVEDEVGPEEAAARTGAPLEVARWAQRKLYQAEYKRFQFAPTLRVSRKAWVGRAYPIVHRFSE